METLTKYQIRIAAKSSEHTGEFTSSLTVATQGKSAAAPEESSGLSGAVVALIVISAICLTATIGLLVWLYFIMKAKEARYLKYIDQAAKATEAKDSKNREEQQPTDRPMMDTNADAAVNNQQETPNENKDLELAKRVTKPAVQIEVAPAPPITNTLV